MQPDPRTVAREIPGILDEIFPQLTPGNVTHINTQIAPFAINRVSPDLIHRSKLQKAMLFELACTVGEHLIQGDSFIDWEICFRETLNRQRVYFDAKLPESIDQNDKTIAEMVGKNLAETLNLLSKERGEKIVVRPFIPGLEWVSSGNGDFALGSTLIEVKCTAKRFSSADYRQVAMYWLLSYAASIEERGDEWREFILLNPRSGEKLTMRFDTLLSTIGGDRTKVDILLLFQSLVGSRIKA